MAERPLNHVGQKQLWKLTHSLISLDANDHDLIFDLSNDPCSVMKASKLLTRLTIRMEAIVAQAGFLQQRFKTSDYDVPLDQ